MAVENIAHDEFHSSQKEAEIAALKRDE